MIIETKNLLRKYEQIVSSLKKEIETNFKCLTLKLELSPGENLPEDEKVYIDYKFDFKSGYMDTTFYADTLEGIKNYLNKEEVKRELGNYNDVDEFIKGRIV